MPGRYGTPCFDPQQAIEGNPASPIWVIALNPKTKTNQHKRRKSNPVSWNRKDTDANAPHFRRLKLLLGDKWYTSLLKDGGVAHTDLLKCGSPGFTSTEKAAVSYCKEFLIDQIRKYRPKLLLVLSSDASKLIAEHAQLDAEATEGDWLLAHDSRCYVVLSGYSSPRQERYAKLRLRRDFTAACSRLNLNPPNSTAERDAR